MKEKKIFGILAVVLMLLIVFQPLVCSEESTSIKLEKESEIGVATYGNCDLGVEIIKCYVKETIPLVAHHPMDGQVEYLLQYKIKNYQDQQFNGNVELNITSLALELNEICGNWVLPIFSTTLGPEEERTGEYSFGTFLSSADITVDMERKLAGKVLSLKITPIDFNDINTQNNVYEKYVSFWEGGQGTAPEIEAGAPHCYKKIYCVPQIPDLYKLDFFDVRILPNFLKSERMGWAGQLAEYLAVIGGDAAAILGATMAFLYTVKDDIKIVTQWLIDFFEWFYSAIHGNIFGVAQLIYDFITYVIPAVSRILTKAVPYGATVIVLCQKLFDDVDAAYNWTKDDPWTKKIKICGTVDRVKLGEIVTVSCREESKDFRDEDGDGSISYELTVSSEAKEIYNENHQEGIHRCVVTVTGDKHNGKADSIPILSYAFANGSLHWDFPKPGDKAKDKSYLGQAFTDKLKDWLKNKPLLTFFEKLLEKIVTLKETWQKTSSNTRDFDLNVLMKKVKEEKYELYEGLEYKPYYTDAPKDPNVVYYSSEQVIVGFKSYVDITQIDEVEGYPVVDKIPELNTVVVEIYGIEPEQFVEMVENLADVEYAEMDYVYQSYFTPNDYYWDSQWGPKAINCPEAWDIEKGSALAKVAIIDTGCNYNHKDIKCKESYVNYDFVNNDDDPMDDNGHGTHCAGIIGATMNNELGIAGVLQCFTDYIKVLDGSGAGYASTVAKGIIHAAKNMGSGSVISMSLGGYGISVMVHAACDYAYYIKGVLLFAAAGNDGLPRVGYPARFDSVIAVGAVGENLELCSWSNYGPDVDLVAPGENIISTYGNGYERLSGTSMACPHVAGVAALYFSRFGLDASAILCKGKLFSTAIDLGSPGRDNYYGHGLVNAYEMVNKKTATRYNLQNILGFLPRLKNFVTSSMLLQQIIKTLPN